MANRNLPVQVLAACGVDGQMQPLRFRFEDSEHQLHTVHITEIIDSRFVEYVGIETFVFLCKALLEGAEKLYELRVRNLRFYKSQPWVFTDTLLFGFFAELDGSDKITVQEDELSEAGWFYRSEIPEDRTHLSLTGEMMEQFRKGLA